MCCFSRAQSSGQTGVSITRWTLDRRLSSALRSFRPWICLLSSRGTFHRTSWLNQTGQLAHQRKTIFTEGSTQSLHLMQNARRCDSWQVNGGRLCTIGQCHPGGPEVCTPKADLWTCPCPYATCLFLLLAYSVNSEWNAISLNRK